MVFWRIVTDLRVVSRRMWACSFAVFEAMGRRNYCKHCESHISKSTGILSSLASQFNDVLTRTWIKVSGSRVEYCSSSLDSEDDEKISKTSVLLLNVRIKWSRC